MNHPLNKNDILLQDNLIEKIINNEGKTLFKCLYNNCNKICTTRGNIKRHLIIHTENKRFICKYCNKRFFRKADRNIHHRIHTGEKPFSCSQCSVQFARLSDLRSHERIHLGLKPFICPYDTCTSRFARKFDLKKHLMMHFKNAGYNVTEYQEKMNEYLHKNNNDSISQLHNTKQTQKNHHLNTLKRCRHWDTLNGLNENQDILICKHLELKADKKHNKLTIRSPSESSYATTANVDNLSNLSKIYESSNLIDNSLNKENIIEEINKKNSFDLDEFSCIMKDKSIEHSLHGDGCGHLSLKHHDHLDYVVDNHIICEDSIKHIFCPMTEGDNTIDSAITKSQCKYNSSSAQLNTTSLSKEMKEYINKNIFYSPRVAATDSFISQMNDDLTSCSTTNSHGAGCGHIPIRHDNHIDYLLEDDRLFCQNLGAPLFDPTTEDLELLDDDFFQFFDAVDSMNVNR